MFERFIALLIRLYPIGFRESYGREALQLMRDRARDERGVALRLRLCVDLLRDALSMSLKGWSPAEPALMNAPGSVRVPSFQIIEQGGPKPQSLMAGMLSSMLMFATFTLLFEPSQFANVPARLGIGEGSNAPFDAGEDSQQPVTVDVSAARHELIVAIAANLKQRYTDREIGQRLGTALLTYEKNGAYDGSGFGEVLARRLTNHIHDTSRSLGVPAGTFVADVVYSETPLPEGPPPPRTDESRARNRAAVLRQNCFIQTIETLPRNIGYLKLNAFADAGACHEITARAMASVNHATALIIDLRDNRGGFGSTALQIAAHLFDRAAFMYDPRPNSPEAGETASPVAGNQLADKPVYVLTSSATQSAAEYFAYNLKMHKRAVVVGERTAGHQHSGAFHRLTDHFGMGIQEELPPPNPFPVKGWETIGVEPDVRVAHDDALYAAIKLAGQQSRSFR
jgi:hypothetical protein